MSYRFDTPLVANGYHFGNRGLGVLGSEIASTGTSGAGYLYNDLSLPADANKEYSGYVVTPPGVGTFFAFEDSSFTYEGPSTSFTYRLREDGVDKGSQEVIINMISDPAGSLGWTEANDVTLTSVLVVPTASVVWTEANDTFNLTTLVKVNTTISLSENDDTWAVATNVSGTTSAAVSWTEADDTLLSTIGITVVGTHSWVEDTDTTSIVALVTYTRTGALSWTEVNDIHHIVTSVPNDTVATPLPARLDIKFKNPKYKITFLGR